MTPEEKRGLARELLEAFAAGDEFERQIRDGEIAGLRLYDEADFKEMPEGIGELHDEPAHNCVTWYAPPSVVNAVKQARARKFVP
jgi:hypothetical protein